MTTDDTWITWIATPKCHVTLESTKTTCDFGCSYDSSDALPLSISVRTECMPVRPLDDSNPGDCIRDDSIGISAMMTSPSRYEVFTAVTSPIDGSRAVCGISDGSEPESEACDHSFGNRCGNDSDISKWKPRSNHRHDSW